MVEFALVLPVLLMLFFGIIEISRLMYIYSIVTTASREGVRYASAIGDNGSGTERYRDCTGIEQAAMHLGGLAGITAGDITIEYDNGPGSSVYDTCSTLSTDVALGDRVIVTVNGQYTPIGIIPYFNMPSFNIPSVSRRMVVDEISLGTGGNGGGGGGGGEEEEESYTPYAPVYVNVQGTPLHNKCTDVLVSWTTNSDWNFTPGTDPSTYELTWNTFTNAAITHPTTQYQYPDYINHNSSVTVEIYADFGSENSEVLTIHFDCMSGDIVNILHNP
jgi:hypothetical protein